MKKLVLLNIVFALIFTVCSMFPAYSQNVFWEHKSTHQYDAINSVYYHLPQDVVVGVVDAGLNYNHPDLIDHLWDGGEKYPNHGYDFTAPDNDPITTDPHGTFVAGVISFACPNAKIAGLKIIDGTYNNSMFTSAIKFAIKNNIKILNASFGGSVTQSKDVDDAIKAYDEFGGLLIASAGNKKNNNDKDRVYPSCYGYDCIISVASINKSDELASFSNWGQETVDVVAPGVLITGPVKNNDRDLYNGTSASAPMVSALVAYLWGINPKLTSKDIKKIIMETCDFLPSLDDKIKAGKINFLEAFNKVVGNIQNESYCYKNKFILKQSLINGWQKIIVNNVPSKMLQERVTMNYFGDNALKEAQKDIDDWDKKGLINKECDCQK